MALKVFFKVQIFPNAKSMIEFVLIIDNLINQDVFTIIPGWWYFMI